MHDEGTGSTISKGQKSSTDALPENCGSARKANSFFHLRKKSLSSSSINRRLNWWSKQSDHILVQSEKWISRISLMIPADVKIVWTLTKWVLNFLRIHFAGTVSPKWEIQQSPTGSSRIRRNIGRVKITTKHWNCEWIFFQSRACHQFRWKNTIVVQDVTVMRHFLIYCNHTQWPTGQWSTGKTTLHTGWKNSWKE